MTKPTVAMDVECYRNYFLIKFKNADTGNTRDFPIYPGSAPMDAMTVRKILASMRIVTFNGNNYDVPMVSYALQLVKDGVEPGEMCAKLKRASDMIIANGLKPWIVAERLGFSICEPDHVDLIEVAPGVASLKVYGGRLHSRRLQDLPIDPDADITPAQRPQLSAYCGNDLQTTLDLLAKLTPQITLREQMSAEYGIDLRSKSDAQIAEAVIKAGVSKALGRKVYRPEVDAGTQFNYKAPAFISFASEQLREVLRIVTTEPFTVTDTGKVNMPEQLHGLKITIGTSTYQMGIGGLHSTESCVAHVADDEWTLVDRDVTSYYPAIIINNQLYPKHLGPEFLRVYKGIVDRRVKAKREGDKVTDASLKITINGSFGKFGSKWSALYSPDLLIQTTITGQLSLLMLIEMLESYGVQVVSANTDGLVMRHKRTRSDITAQVVTQWEGITGFTTEATEYRALYSKDVNNYIAIKPDGEYKLKGLYTPAGLQKNPTAEIAAQAVVEYLRKGTPIEQTITGCQDVRKFVTIRAVKGGALTEIDLIGEEYLGRAVRWYYSTLRRGEVIRYKINGNTVARSEGAMPLMQLPDELPSDIDFDWYIAEANNILQNIGAKP